MSKKMKRLAFESSQDSKHLTLLHDYQLLHKETDDMSNKLKDAKLKKQRLLAEVQFLRRRYKYLVQMKLTWSHLVEQERVALPNSDSYYKNGMKNRLPFKKEAKMHKLSLIPERARIHVEKEDALPRILVNHKQVSRIDKDAGLHCTASLDHKSRIHHGKEVPLRKAVTPSSFDLNRNDRSFAEDTTVSRVSRTPTFDLNKATEDVVILPTRAPVIDLNEISVEDEDPQANFDSLKFEEPKIGLIRDLNDDQHCDMLSVCRNLGEGTSRAGKQKISWQDPVALRV